MQFSWEQLYFVPFLKEVEKIDIYKNTENTSQVALRSKISFVCENTVKRLDIPSYPRLFNVRFLCQLYEFIISSRKELQYLLTYTVKLG